MKVPRRIIAPTGARNKFKETMERETEVVLKAKLKEPK